MDTLNTNHDRIKVPIYTLQSGFVLFWIILTKSFVCIELINLIWLQNINGNYDRVE